MAVLEREALKERVRTYIGDRSGDEDISILEDINDTIDSLTTPGEDWKAKYEENDASWRKRYMDRFGGKDEGTDPATEQIDTVEAEGKSYSYDDLFKEG